MLRESFWCRAAWGVVAASILACVITWVTDTNSESSLKRGDYPAFYSLAVLASTNPSQLYDFERQRQVQNAAWPSLKGEFLIASYPPYTAWLLQPLARLSPTQGKLVFTLLMFAALLGAPQIIRRLNPSLSNLPFPPELLVLFWAPLSTATLGGQNTALSLLLLSGIVLLLASPKVKHGDFWAGVLLGLWAFKPQYALPMLLATVLLGRRRVIWGALPILTLYYLAGIAVLGPDWISLWLTSSLRFAQLNLETNGYQIISIVAGSREISRLLFSGPDTAVAALLGVTLSLLVAVELLRTLSQLSPEARISIGLPLTAAGLTLLTPQTTYYDIGIFSVALLLLTTRVFSLSSWLILLSLQIGAQLLRDYTHAPLFFLIAILLFFRTTSALRKGS